MNEQCEDVFYRTGAQCVLDAGHEGYHVSEFVGWGDDAA